MYVVLSGRFILQTEIRTLLLILNADHPLLDHSISGFGDCFILYTLLYVLDSTAMKPELFIVLLQHAQLSQRKVLRTKRR